MHVAVDATPLLGAPTGVGRYVRGLVDALPAAVADRARTPPPGGHGGTAPGEVTDVTAVTVSARRGARGLELPPGTGRRSLRLPAPVWRRTTRRPSRSVDLLTGRPDVWHATNFVAPVPRGPALTVTVHDLAFLDLPGTVAPGALALRELLPAVLRHAAAVCTVSAFSAGRLREAYPWLRVPVVVVPLGVDPAWSTALPPDAAVRARLGLPERYVVAVGTREPRKNLGTVVRAHRAAGAGAPPLVLLGSAGWGADLDGEQAGPDVLRTGRLPDEDLRRVVAGAQTLLAPSRYEGFGLTVLEGLAAGVPVLASDIPPHREVAGDLARLLPVDDVGAWSAALREPATTAGPADLRARDARRALAAGHTWDACARAHLALWQGLARHRGTDRARP